MDVTLLPPPLCPPARAAAAPIPLLRIRLNGTCLSRLDAASAAAKKPIRPVPSHDGDPPAKRHGGAPDKKDNKNAPTPATAKIGSLLRPCSGSSAVGDEAPRSALGGGSTKRWSAGAAVGHAAALPAAKRKATTPDSGQTAKRRASPPRVPIVARKQQATAAGGDGAASASPSPRSSDSEGTVRALLARARPASDAIRRRDIDRLRTQARWELEQMVQTVEFNDPFITPQDVLR
ncbi:unnamed protein product [Urochloa humidicola]